MKLEKWNYEQTTNFAASFTIQTHRHNCSTALLAHSLFTSHTQIFEAIFGAVLSHLGLPFSLRVGLCHQGTSACGDQRLLYMQFVRQGHDEVTTGSFLFQILFVQHPGIYSCHVHHYTKLLLAVFVLLRSLSVFVAFDPGHQRRSLCGCSTPWALVWISRH